MKYKVGDKVRIKSLEWYKENRDISGDIAIGDTFFRDFMLQFCGSVVTIESIELVANLMCYRIKEDGRHYCWVDEMIEGLVEEETKPKYEDEVNGEYYSTPKYLVRPSGYQFVDENCNVINATKIVLEKKKKEYPKTYEECCKILNLPVRDLDILDNMLDTTEIIYSKNLDRLLNSFRKLLICRDAYWKIAGDEMGLGKPWEPDWDTNENELFVIANYNGTIVKTGWYYVYTKILAFPTEEMRDIFYENFKELIESCKELL